MVEPPQVVAGVGDTSLAAVQEFYGKLVADLVPVSSTRAAEREACWILHCRNRLSGANVETP